MKLETVAEALFEVCQDKSRTTKDCVTKLVDKLGVIPANCEKLEKAVRDYRLSGKGLSEAAQAVIDATGCDSCDSPFDCHGGFTDPFDFKTSLKHFEDRKFYDPKAAAILAQHLRKTLIVGNELKLEDITEQYGSTYKYHGTVYNTMSQSDLRESTIDSVAECIADSAYDMARDEVDDMTIEQVAERYAGGWCKQVMQAEDPESDDDYIIIEE